MNIFVSNLGFNSRDEDLKRIFEAFGEVASAKVIIDKFTNRSKGFGFVEMPDENAAKKAISDLDGTMVDGRPIKVNVARPKESSNSNSSFRSNKRW